MPVSLGANYKRVFELSVDMLCISDLVKNLKKFSRTDEKMKYSNQSLTWTINDAFALTELRLKRELVDFRYVDTSKGIIFCNPI